MSETKEHPPILSPEQREQRRQRDQDVREQRCRILAEWSEKFPGVFSEDDPNPLVIGIGWRLCKAGIPKRKVDFMMAWYTGRYRLLVQQFRSRETKDFGFEAQIDFMGDVKTFRHDKRLRQGETVTIAEFEYRPRKGIQRQDAIEFISSLPAASPAPVGQKIWGIDTHAFQRVNVVMLSPNHWDGRVGHRHYFFMLDQCANDGSARGFYNEFLGPDLMQHRKVFEVLGAKMRAEMSPEQLSGVGFSSTQRNSIVARVSGARTVRVTF